MLLPTPVVVRTRSWLLVAALSTVALAGPRATGCGACSKSATPAPSLAWDGDTMAVAYASPTYGSTGVRFWRLGEERNTFLIERRDIIGTPELTWTGDHHTLIVNAGRDGLLAMAVSRRGKAGKPRKLAKRIGALCTKPLSDGEHLWVGWADPVPGRFRLGRLGHGSSQTFEVPAPGNAGDSSCALALGGGHVALAVAFTQHDESILGLARIDRDGQPAGFTEILRSPKRIEALRLARVADGWALLHRVGDRAALSLLDPVGAVRRGIAIPATVDPARADLASSHRGFAVAWTRQDRAVEIRAHRSDGTVVSAFEHRTKGVPSPARAAVRDGTCYASWSELDGSVPWVMWSERCFE